MRRRTCLFAALPAAALMMSVAEAQTTADDQSIVVTGKREDPKKRTARFVRQILDTNTGQLARFAEPVCPLVLGVPASSAAAITDRIRRVATASKVPVAPAGCAPNLLAVVAADTDTFIKTMRKRHGSFFDGLSDVDFRDAVRPGLVRGWRLVEMRDEDGAPVSGDPPVVETNSSSVFSAHTQAVTVNAVVVLDKSVVLDKTIAQLADYVAMRSLAGARPPKDAAIIGETILSLFDPGSAPPKEWTAMDKGLLAGLYTARTTASATAQASQITREMLRAEGTAPAK